MKAVAWVALVLALVGSMLAMSAYWRVRSAPAAPAGTDLEDLKARIARLERDLAAAPRSTAEPGSAPAPVESSAGELTDLKRRIDVLEQRQGPGRFQPPDTGRPTRGNQGLIDVQKKRLFDPAQADRTRAQALSVLRGQGANKADDVVDAGLALLAQAKEASTRSLVLRSLQGADNVRVVAPALTILGSDPDEMIRQEAAGTLGDYVQRPEVKAALEQAASSDASERVRHRAQAALTPRPTK